MNDTDLEEIVYKYEVLIYCRVVGHLSFRNAFMTLMSTLYYLQAEVDVNQDDSKIDVGVVMDTSRQKAGINGTLLRNFTLYYFELKKKCKKAGDWDFITHLVKLINFLDV